jgi:APA family basic amino acid/polyamine antiporter
VSGHSSDRRLTAWSATALVVSEVVGVGILLSPATMLRTLGGAWAPLAMWLAMGTLTAAGALCYAELTTRFPKAGGAYVFLREGFGRRCAFVYGWMAMLVMDPGITAALGIGFAQYALATAGLSPALAPLCAVLAIAGFALLAARGLGPAARVLTWTAAVKLAIVGLLILAGLWRFTSGAPLMPGRLEVGLAPLASAAVAAFFAFGGWWDLGRMSEEVESPKTTMPIALVGGVFLVTAIYVLVTLAIVLAAPDSPGSSGDALVTAAGSALFGPRAGGLLSAMVVVSVSGSLAAVLLGGPRTYAAMARDHLLPAGGAWFDPQRGRSVAGTAIQGSIACVLVVLGTFDQILGYFVPAAVFFLGLSAATLWRVPRNRDAETVFRAPLFPLPLIVFLALIALMLVLFAGGQPVQTLLGAMVVFIGLLVSRFVA